jgi:hypothetical protein
MIGLLCFVLASPSKSKLRPEAENAVLRSAEAEMNVDAKGKKRLDECHVRRTHARNESVIANRRPCNGAFRCP